MMKMRKNTIQFEPRMASCDIWSTTISHHSTFSDYQGEEREKDSSEIGRKPGAPQPGVMSTFPHI